MADIAMEDAATAVVTRAADGDQVAFARLVAEHHAAMMRVAYVITGDSEAAEDAVQSTWAIAWRRLHSLRDRSQIRPWLVAIVGNEARQQVRRRRRVTIVDVSHALDRPGHGEPSDLIPVVDLRRALARLDPSDRTLLALRYVAGFDSSEIARQLGLSASGVRSRLARLVERLRSDLEPGEGPRP